MTTMDVTGKKDIAQTIADIKKGGKSDTAIDRKEEAHAIIQFAKYHIQENQSAYISPQDQISLLTNWIEAVKYLNLKDLSKTVLNKLNESYQVLRHYYDPDNSGYVKKVPEGIISDTLDLLL